MFPPRLGTCSFYQKNYAVLFCEIEQNLVKSAEHALESVKKLTKTDEKGLSINHAAGRTSVMIHVRTGISFADFLSHYCNAHAIDYSCKMYDSGEPLYYELGDGGWFDIILLDILMDPPLGIDAVARRLRGDRLAQGARSCTKLRWIFAPDSF